MRESLRDIAFMVKEVPYPAELPEELKHLHCYILDGGHSILAVPVSLLDEARGQYALYEVPLPVKYVLEKGWKRISGTDSVSVEVEYDMKYGAVVPDGYEEF